MFGKFVLSPDGLAVISGFILALFFSYFPRVKVWWEKLAPDPRRGFMSLFLIVVAGAIFGLNCGGLIIADFTCTQGGAVVFVKALFLALIANQGLFPLLPKFK